MNSFNHQVKSQPKITFFSICCTYLGPGRAWLFVSFCKRPILLSKDSHTKKVWAQSIKPEPKPDKTRPKLLPELDHSPNLTRSNPIPNQSRPETVPCPKNSGPTRFQFALIFCRWDSSKATRFARPAPRRTRPPPSCWTGTAWSRPSSSFTVTDFKTQDPSASPSQERINKFKQKTEYQRVCCSATWRPQTKTSTSSFFPFRDPILFVTFKFKSRVFILPML
jgi:hypothetical protein